MYLRLIVGGGRSDSGRVRVRVRARAETCDDSFGRALAETVLEIARRIGRRIGWIMLILVVELPECPEVLIEGLGEIYSREGDPK